jgi:hypothetical protein
MTKLPKEKRDRILLVAVGTLMVAAVLYFGLIQGQRAMVKTKTAKLREAVDKSSQASQTIKKAALYRAELTVVTTTLDGLETGMAVGGMPWIYRIIPTFLETRHRSLVLSDIPNTPRYGDVGFIGGFPYTAVTYSVELTGQYQDFGVFLADFENQYPYLRIQSLEIGSPRKAVPGDEDRLGFRMDIMALVKPGATP